MVNIEIKDAYNKYFKRDETSTKVISVQSTYLTRYEMVVGLTYIDVCSRRPVLRGGQKLLYTSNIAVGVTPLGMNILKNRDGSDFGVFGNVDVRRVIFHSLREFGFSNLDACYILGTFNEVVKGLKNPQPMVKFQRLRKHKMI